MRGPVCQSEFLMSQGRSTRSLSWHKANIAPHYTTDGRKTADDCKDRAVAKERQYQTHTADEEPPIRSLPTRWPKLRPKIHAPRETECWNYGPGGHMERECPPPDWKQPRNLLLLENASGPQQKGPCWLQLVTRPHPTWRKPQDSMRQQSQPGMD